MNCRLMNILCICKFMYFFFFNDTATTKIYTLSLHDALPICKHHGLQNPEGPHAGDIPNFTVGGKSNTKDTVVATGEIRDIDRKSTRLNSSHVEISYAVFCLKKKKKKIIKINSYSFSKSIKYF